MPTVTLSQVLTTARTYLNDDNAIQFPDPVLIPKAQEAHRELQEELWAIGSPIVRAQVGPIAYPGGGTPPLIALSVVGPPLFPPLDFLCPTAVYEGASGDTLAAVDWTPVTEVFYVPLGTANQGKINYWVWQNETLYISPTAVGSPRAVVVQYRRLIPIPALNTDNIGIQFGESYLAARTAALAAGAVGNAEIMKVATEMAKENLSKVIAANRGAQRPMSYPYGSNLSGINK